MPEIKLGHRIVPYSIRESKRARYVNFRIDAENGLQVILPAGARVHNLEDLLRQRQSWILRHLRRAEKAQEQKGSRQFVSGEKLPFLGEDYELDIILTARAKQTSVARQAKFIRVRLRSGLSPDAQAKEVRRALEGWYRQQAQEYIPRRAAELAQAYGFQYKQLTIRGQRTRWGSCSSGGGLNFNWRLMMTPTAAIDYVIIHELCHLRELNHSAAFWALVEQYCPNYKYWVRWLKQNSARLRL